MNASSCRRISSSATLCGALHRGLNVQVAAQLRSEAEWRLAVVVAEKQILQGSLLCLA